MPSSRPGNWLTGATILLVAAGVALPYTPLARFFGFTPLPIAFMGILAVMIVIYVALVEAGKSLFFSGRLPRLPAVPVSNWERTPAVQAIERMASRWTVPSLRLSREPSPRHEPPPPKS